MVPGFGPGPEVTPKMDKVAPPGGVGGWMVVCAPATDTGPLVGTTLEAQVAQHWNSLSCSTAQDLWVQVAVGSSPCGHVAVNIVSMTITSSSSPWGHAAINIVCVTITG